MSERKGRPNRRDLAKRKAFEAELWAKFAQRDAARAQDVEHKIQRVRVDA